MKILLTSIGTRGDMEPFLAIGELLKSRGHNVISAFPEQFKKISEESKIKFFSLGSEFIEMLESETGKTALGSGGSGIKKILAFIKLAKLQKNINKGLVKQQYKIIEEEKPDIIVHNGKAMYPVIWEVKNPGKTVFVSPVPYLHYVKGHSHIAFNSNFGDFFNKLSYKLADWGLLNAITNSIKLLKIKDIVKKEIKNVLSRHKIIYTISPQLFSRPSYWKKNLLVLGYHERNKSMNWSAPGELTDFLKKHSKILMVTFGSMTNPEPAEKTKILIDILERNKIPTIINTAAGGLIEPESYNKDLIYFVSQIPYDWLLPKIYAVIHHGGSGTTHSTIKYGCSSMIIPHIIDQFVWNRLLHKKGVGPKGIKIGKLNTKTLEPKILDLYYNDIYKKKAGTLSQLMNKENFADQLVDEIINISEIN